eukprot:scaffold17656_cov31-Phaeocystis_antarctica.AAC.1
MPRAAPRSHPPRCRSPLVRGRVRVRVRGRGRDRVRGRGLGVAHRQYGRRRRAHDSRCGWRAGSRPAGYHPSSCAAFESHGLDASRGAGWGWG